MTGGQVVGIQDKDTFLAWTDAVLGAEPKVKVYAETETGRVTKIAIDTDALPAELADPDAAKVWTKQRWVKKQRDQLGVVGEGITLLGKERTERFAAAEASASANAKPAASRNTDTPQTKGKNPARKEAAAEKAVAVKAKQPSDTPRSKPKARRKRVTQPAKAAEVSAS